MTEVYLQSHYNLFKPFMQLNNGKYRHLGN